jgi:hypothetical protein
MIQFKKCHTSGMCLRHDPVVISLNVFVEVTKIFNVYRAIFVDKIATFLATFPLRTFILSNESG